ncbi:histone-lysine N-methyltransferase PRDM9-like [Bufo bufo]|uniref:histone-lysine N-methyltransferase PRDM9-like n=1 Tax=Bufo bufo TaxID=8384 RepID=UPI001ABDEF6D|nr:histone-lysine N-methyltransferase PRDM9-like [Bufo bufo]XP_040282443.1 histone-lysine N-methyltransferase PRDM9-like [Bufo bufo]
MHICKERGRISELLRHSLTMHKDKMEVTEKILNLTLEIIFLLTGEDFVLSKKQDDRSPDDCQLCLSEGPSKDQSPNEERPCQSPAPEEATEEETPEPSENTQSTAQEVPVRCEDIAVFLSLEEWEYLEGHKECYKDVVSEDNQPPVPADCDRVIAADEDTELNEEDAATTAADAPSTGGDIPTNPPESCTSPLIPQKCPEEDDSGVMMTEDHQASPGGEILPPPLKEEDDPVEISSGDPKSANPPEISGSPVRSQDCIDGDIQIIPQKYQAKTGDVVSNWRKKRPNPTKIRSGHPTTWKVQPDSPHLLIPVHHKNGVHPSNLEGSFSSDAPPVVVMVKPKSVLNEALPPRSKTEQPHLFWQNPRVDASSSHLMQYGGGAVNLPPLLESPALHKCLQCGRGFRNELDLLSHQRTHEKPFHCVLCQQSFMDKSSLVVHEWTFHIPESKVGKSRPKRVTKEEKPFSCLECGKTFMKKSSLVKHQRIHTGAFACPDCGKCLSDKTGLIIHRRTHTGEKPYACSECGRRFTQRCHLITHQSVHTSKESFACSDCGKCFSVRSVLEAHQAFHNRHRAFTCSACGKCFLQKSALMAHSKVHAMEPYSVS